MRRITVWIAVGLLALSLAHGSAGAAPVHYVIGVGVWNSGGRVSTLEMVGLNPQPEPPSRTAIAIYTSGAAVVSIRISCAAMPRPDTYAATGKGTNGLWYRITIVNARSLGAPDLVGVNPVAVPPNPCSETATVPLTVGAFFIR